MNTVKYILINIEMILMVISVMLGTGAAESHMWGWAYFLILLPFGWGYLTNFSKQMNFYEAYSRAWSIKIKSNK